MSSPRRDVDGLALVGRMGSEEAARALVGMFVESLPELAAALKTGAPDTVARALHALRGAASATFATRLEAVVAEAESTLRVDGMDRVDLEPVFEAIDAFVVYVRTNRWVPEGSLAG